MHTIRSSKSTKHFKTKSESDYCINEVRHHAEGRRLNRPTNDKKEGDTMTTRDKLKLMAEIKARNDKRWSTGGQ